MRTHLDSTQDHTDQPHHFNKNIEENDTSNIMTYQWKHNKNLRDNSFDNEINYLKSKQDNSKLESALSALSKDFLAPSELDQPPPWLRSSKPLETDQRLDANDNAIIPRQWQTPGTVPQTLAAPAHNILTSPSHSPMASPRTPRRLNPVKSIDKSGNSQANVFLHKRNTPGFDRGEAKESTSFQHTELDFRSLKDGHEDVPTIVFNSELSSPTREKRGVLQETETDFYEETMKLQDIAKQRHFRHDSYVSSSSEIQAQAQRSSDTEGDKELTVTRIPWVASRSPYKSSTIGSHKPTKNKIHEADNSFDREKNNEKEHQTMNDFITAQRNQEKLDIDKSRHKLNTRPVGNQFLMSSPRLLAKRHAHQTADKSSRDMQDMKITEFEEDILLDPPKEFTNKVGTEFDY